MAMCKEERCTVCLKDLAMRNTQRRLDSETFHNPCAWRLTEMSHANYLRFVWASSEAAKEPVLNLLTMSENAVAFSI